MLKVVVKTCGVAVSLVLQSGNSYTPSVIYNHRPVDNNGFYTSTIDSLLTSFKHSNGGHFKEVTVSFFTQSTAPITTYNYIN